jgi:membrane-associated phospholipid phosphatase
MPKQNIKRERYLRRYWHEAREWIASPGLRRVRLYLFQGYVLVALLAFSALALLANVSPIFQPDVTFTRELQQAPSWFGLIMEVVSIPGYAVETIVVMALTAIVLGMLGLRWEAIAAIFAGVAAGALNTLVKIAVRRPRPSADLVHVFQNLNSYSFPSGHVMFYTAFFGFLLFLTFILIKYSWRRTLLEIVLGLLILLVGPSRMYLGEHWGSDVLGGYLLGSLMLILSIQFYRWGKERFFIPQTIAVTGPDDTRIKPEEKKELKENLDNPLLTKKEEMKAEVQPELHKTPDEPSHDPDHPDHP